ncbi:hypothetical protein MHZ93_03785 [Roseomonas sp. ACRSG]|nr:hypothetical protein [Roseomonas sp. ACRSG]
MERIHALLQQAPELAIFAALAVGVPLGRLRLGRFALGNAAAVLLVAVVLGITLTGPAGVVLPTTLKTFAFGLFVFSVGFSGGPQFFASLSWRTLDTVAVALTVAVVGLLSSIAMARLLGFDKGTAAGLAAGSLTETALLGTASGALAQLALPAAEIHALEGRAAVAFALTYVFGTIAVVFFCSQVAPRLMRVDLQQAARALESRIAASGNAPRHGLAYRRIDARGFRVTTGAGQRIDEIEAALAEGHGCIEHLRRDGQPVPVTAGERLQVGDEVVVAGRRPAIVVAAGLIGPELEGWDLLAPLETFSAEGGNPEGTLGPQPAGGKR